MAEMHILPLRPQSIDAITRLSSELDAAHTRGQDLGPRALHIQAGGVQLHEMSRQLEHAVDALDQMLKSIGMMGRVDDLRRMLSAVQTLADMAQKFPFRS